MCVFGLPIASSWLYGYDLSSSKIIICRRVLIDEHVFPFQKLHFTYDFLCDDMSAYIMHHLHNQSPNISAPHTDQPDTQTHPLTGPDPVSPNTASPHFPSPPPTSPSQSLSFSPISTPTDQIVLSLHIPIQPHV